MTFDTGRTYKEAQYGPKHDRFGDNYGTLTKENNAIVNPADWLAEVTDPNDSRAINVNAHVSGVAPIPNFSRHTAEGRVVHFEANFDSGYDTLNTFTGAFENVLMPESRNHFDTSANGSFQANILESSLEMSVVADGPVSPTIHNESKNYIKMPQSGITYLQAQGVFEHNGVSTTNTTTFGAFQVGRSPGSISRPNFNIDVFDGSGPSGITLDFKKLQTVVFQYIGKNKGDVKLGFLVNDVLYFAHQFEMNNFEDFTLNYNIPFADFLSVGSPTSVGRTIGLFNLSTGYAFGSIMDTTNDPTLSVTQTLNNVVCFTVGADKVERKIPFTAGNKDTYKIVTSANTPLFSIKAAPTFKGNVNRTVFNIEKLTINTAELNSNSGCNIRVFYNTTLTGDSFVALPDNAESALLVDTSATSISGGIELFSTQVMANRTYEFDLNNILKNYRNEFSRNEFAFGSVILEQIITVVASPMIGGNNPTATIDVSANIFGGEVG